MAFPVSIKSKYPYSATGDFPSRLSEPLMEPVATMAVLVGATKRVRIGTAALIMPYRNPVLLARMLVTLDHFSGGRIVLGAGVGWLEEEFNVLDAHDFKRRGKVTDEYLEIFKAICAGGEVSYRGETYAFEPIFSSPGSVQRPHPPILIGGLSDAALRRVVRHGNGWLAVTAGPEMLAERLATLKRLAQEAGRRFEDLSLAYKLFLSIGEAKRSRYDAREPGTGSRRRDRGRHQAPLRSRLPEDHRALSRQHRRRPEGPDRPLRDRDRSQGVAGLLRDPLLLRPRPERPGRAEPGSCRPIRAHRCDMNNDRRYGARSRIFADANSGNATREGAATRGRRMPRLQH